MKALVETIQQDTERTIKTLMKEAQEKIKSGSVTVMNDVLQLVVAQYQGTQESTTEENNQLPEAANQEIEETKETGNSQKTSTSSTGSRRKVNTTPPGTTQRTSTRKTGAGSRKTVPTTDTNPSVEADLS